MRYYLLLLAIIFSSLYTQAQDLANLRKSGYSVRVYRIPADSTEKYIRQDSINVDAYLSQTPVHIFPWGNVSTDTLPKGHYLLVSIRENYIQAWVEVVTDLSVYTINNDQYIQLAVTNKQGGSTGPLQAWCNRKQLSLTAAGTFKIKYRPKEDNIIKVCSPTDTVFLTMDVDRETYQSVHGQKWQAFRSTTVGKIITFIPRTVKSIFNGRHYKRPKLLGSKGFVVFNQPKYKLGDTVKLKSYIINKKGKRYTQPVKLFLDYYGKGKTANQLLATVTSASAGAYLFEFVLRDTLINDINYTIRITDTKDRRLLQGNFPVEDYVLDEVGTYSLRSDKEQYYPGDSLVFIANAKDANGLGLLDAKVKLVVLTDKVEKWMGDSVMIADTVYQQEIRLNTQGDTRFAFAYPLASKAAVTLKATAIFTNSNNEVHEEDAEVELKSAFTEIAVREQGDSVIAEYRVNGKSVPATGEVDIDGDKMEVTKKINYPVTLPIHPLAESYYFYVDKDSVTANIDINENYTLQFSSMSSGDSLGFTLSNPYQVPVYFTVLNGDHVVETGSSAQSNITWYKISKQSRKAFSVKWQYRWAGKEQSGNGTIGHPYKSLSVQVSGNELVFPGQKDTLEVTVTDRKHQAVDHANLTAYSYNSQFKKYIRRPSLPYTARYRLRTNIERDDYENEDIYPDKKYYLGHHQQWRSRFNLDTMLYYQMLFPKETYMDITAPQQDYYPTVSVHAVQNGIPLPVYMLYINKKLLYYHGVTDQRNYVFPVMAGYTQIVIRLYNKEILIDSIYLQPNYRHHLVFDIDHLPPHSIVKERPHELTADERNLLEMRLWQFYSRDYYNKAWVWQDGQAVSLKTGYVHLVGPFQPYDSLFYFSKDRFSIGFPLEAGYQYQLSPKMARLEKMKVFPNQDKPVLLPIINNFEWMLNDTLMPPPDMTIQPRQQKWLRAVYTYAYYRNEHKEGKGALKINVTASTDVSYVVLTSLTDTLPPLVLQGSTRELYNLPQNIYRLLLVRNDLAVISTTVQVKTAHITCINVNDSMFSPNAWIDSLAAAMSMPSKRLPDSIEKPVIKRELTSRTRLIGTALVEGRVIDGKGRKPIAGVSVVVQNSDYGVVTDANGYFRLNIISGKHILVVSAIGYSPKTLTVEAGYGSSLQVIEMEISNMSLEEVVVKGYGVANRKQSVSASAIEKREVFKLEAQLQGSLAGVALWGSENFDTNIFIRGAASVSGDTKPMYVIDGIPYDEMPKHISPDDMEQIEVLKDAAATALYGSRGTNGVVVISTKTKALRNQFRDYAFWQPQLFTDDKGKVKFAVTYPDNITSWQTFVVGIDKKNRTGIGMLLTRAYKPVMAQLSLPQFATEGDSLLAITKTLNYSKEKYAVNARFTIAGIPVSKWNFELPAAESVIQQQPVIAGLDTLKLQFDIVTATGFKDGEERKLPVFPKGTEESTGNFYILNGDTAVTFMPKQNAPVQLYVQNNTLEVLLDELDHLQRYPYYCMEQTASKLTGLYMEQQVRQSLQQEFKQQRVMEKLLQKLQESQQYDGGWGWWQNGSANTYITNYVLRSLLHFRKDALVETNVRNGLLYLQNKLALLSKDELLQSLATMTLAGHVLDYQPYVKRIQFDSLTLHQQWLYVQVLQQLKVDHTRELNYLLNRKTTTVTGGIFWGQETWLWYNNDRATTVLAYQVLQNEKGQEALLPGIVQYFLEMKKGGYWRNTVESATITAAILPRLLQQNRQFNTPAVLNISGDTSFSVTSFPFRKTIHNSQVLQLQKKGGGITYATLYQDWWNKTPQAVNDKFVVATRFEHNGKTVATLKAGSKVKLKVSVQALQQAEYVMIEVPVPAGCIITGKQANGNIEYFKNKIVVFRELLTKGTHELEFELECRYPGRYTVNPAKVSLMYFPIFYGRNNMQQVEME